MKAFMMLTEFTNVHKNGSNPIVLHVTSDFGTFVMSLLDGKQEGHELVLEKMCNVVLLLNTGNVSCPLSIPSSPIVFHWLALVCN